MIFRNINDNSVNSFIVNFFSIFKFRIVIKRKTYCFKFSTVHQHMHTTTTFKNCDIIINGMPHMPACLISIIQLVFFSISRRITMYAKKVMKEPHLYILQYSMIDIRQHSFPVYNLRLYRFNACTEDHLSDGSCASTISLSNKII